MDQKYLTVSFYFVVFACLASPAQAAFIEFDLTDHSVFGDLNGRAAYGPITISGFDISFTASGRMTTNARDRRGCDQGSGASHNLACDGDGIGIGDDEITANGEWLSVALNWIGDYRISSIELLDLFAPEGRQSEYAQYAINGGDRADVASQSLTGGYVFEPIGSIMSGLTTIDFSTGRNPRSDFALARIVVETQDRESVSEPPVLAILALGLLFSGFLVYRKSAPQRLIA